ncbi:hypothetical protein [Nocardia sp. NPDC058497]|uniref:hypothetical protein n=1 Tax=Nocardia sp. NPDC058497 TaxID=3346529 RepID=UPI00366023F0
MPAMHRHTGRHRTLRGPGGRPRLHPSRLHRSWLHHSRLHRSWLYRSWLHRSWLHRSRVSGRSPRITRCVSIPRARRPGPRFVSQVQQVTGATSVVRRRGIACVAYGRGGRRIDTTHLERLVRRIRHTDRPIPGRHLAGTAA